MSLFQWKPEDHRDGTTLIRRLWGVHLALQFVVLSHVQQFIYDAFGRFYRLISVPDQRVLIFCIHLVTKRSSTRVYEPTDKTTL